MIEYIYMKRKGGVHLIYDFIDKSDIGLISDYIPLNIEKYDNYDEIRFIGAFDDEDNDILVGVLTFDLNEPVNLLQVTVAKEYRRKGVGLSLVKVLLELAYSFGSKNVETVYFRDNNESGNDDFLWHCGFEPVQISKYYTLSVSQILSEKNIAATIASCKTNVISFDECAEYAVNEFWEDLQNKNILNDINEFNYDTKLSKVYISNNKILSCILLSVIDNKTYMLDFLYNSGNAPSLMVMYLIAAAAKELGSVADSDACVQLAAVNDISDKMVNHLFPDNILTEVVRYNINLNKCIPGPEINDDYFIEEESRFIDNGFTPFTNDNLACKDCIFRHDFNGVFSCHRYLEKPNLILSGEDCDKYYNLAVNNVKED